MYLLEHDAKAVLASYGVDIPPGCLVERGNALRDAQLPPGPWMVKAQVPAGGRGKAGLIRSATTFAELEHAAAAMLGQTHRGHVVSSCRIESKRDFAHEAYLSFTLAPERGEVRVLASAQGGVDVEASTSVRSGTAAPESAELERALAALLTAFPAPQAQALAAAGQTLGRAFLATDALLVEVNPLFVLPDGSWLAGDAKMVIDDNALARQPAIVRLLEARADAYVETHLKWKHGFDYVVVDPQGELGLLTTGAGLSMMLIDELRAAGIRPYNFLDVRTGGLRGDASRLVQVLEWIAQGPKVKCVLVNVFAGITNLGEFAQLLVAALERVPALEVPVVTRLVGNALDDARRVLGAANIAVETDLDEALRKVRIALGRGAGTPP
jgi:succinyl-CoA synthetase beta subunit